MSSFGGVSSLLLLLLIFRIGVIFGLILVLREGSRGLTTRFGASWDPSDIPKADGRAQVADLVNDLWCEHSLNDWVLLHLLLHHSALLAFVKIYLHKVSQIGFKWQFLQSFSSLFF